MLVPIRLVLIYVRKNGCCILSTHFLSRPIGQKWIPSFPRLEVVSSSWGRVYIDVFVCANAAGGYFVWRWSRSGRSYQRVVQSLRTSLRPDAQSSPSLQSDSTVWRCGQLRQQQLFAAQRNCCIAVCNGSSTVHTGVKVDGDILSTSTSTPVWTNLG